MLSAEASALLEKIRGNDPTITSLKISKFNDYLLAEDEDDETDAVEFLQIAVDALSKNTYVTKLVIADFSLPIENFHTVLRTIANNTNITQLKFSECHQAELINIFELLKVNTTLQSLHIDCCQALEGQLNFLSDYVAANTALTSLKLLDTIATPGELNQLGFSLLANSNLKEFTFDRISSIKDTIPMFLYRLAHRACNSQLNITFYDCAIGDEAAQAILAFRGKKPPTAIAVKSRNAAILEITDPALFDQLHAPQQGADASATASSTAITRVATTEAEIAPQPHSLISVTPKASPIIIDELIANLTAKAATLVPALQLAPSSQTSKGDEEALQPQLDAAASAGAADTQAQMSTQRRKRGPTEEATTSEPSAGATIAAIAAPAAISACASNKEDHKRRRTEGTPESSTAASAAALPDLALVAQPQSGATGSKTAAAQQQQVAEQPHLRTS